jgi:hypothetical protein
VTRRDFLRAGFLGLGSLSLADLFRLRADTAAATDTAVILVFWVADRVIWKPMT